MEKSTDLITKNADGSIIRQMGVDPENHPVDVQKQKIRTMVDNIYGIQKMRIQCGNRLVASFMGLGEASRNRTAESVKKAKEDKDGKSKEDKENDEKLKKIMLEYRRVTDAIAANVQAKKEKTDDKERCAAGDKAEITDGDGAIDSSHITGNANKRQIMKAIEEIKKNSTSTVVQTSKEEDNNVETDNGTENGAAKIIKKRGRKPKNKVQTVDNTPLEFINDVYDYTMADTYAELLNVENRAVSALTDVVKKHPMWDAFFRDVRGCGPMMAAVCIAYFDPYKAYRPSGFWSYAGLDVVINEDGTTEGRGKRHTEQRTYIDKNGDEQTKNGLTYNPNLKAKLLGVLGTSFIKSAKKDGEFVSVFGEAYYFKKHEYENMEKHKDKTPLHIHRMALRYAVKQFVREMWIVWRKLEGLEIGNPYYEEEKLGRKPHKWNGYALKEIEKRV